MRIAVVSGALANKCLNGGEAWVRLSWVRGLQKLGFTTYIVEHIAPEHCTDAQGQITDFRSSQNLAYFESVTRDFGLAGRAGLICGGGDDSCGMTSAEFRELAASAKILINISGHLPPAVLQSLDCRKAYVDIDPGFTQCWHAAGVPGARLDGHDFYFTIGENIGSPRSGLPTAGILWRPTRQPVVLEDWPAVPAKNPWRFTTVASWRGSFGSLQFQGRMFGSKVHEFRRIIELPARAGRAFEIALQIHPADGKDLDLLRHWGWGIVDPRSVAAYPQDFRQYVQDSAAEFSVAQGVYSETNSGWFSDRTVRYLASAKPVLVQETGFQDQLPVGKGLLSFRTLDEAVRGAESIAANYDEHCAAARRIAEQYFDSSIVLGRLLEDVGVVP